MDAAAFPLGFILEPGKHGLKVECKLCIATYIASVYIFPLPVGLATMTLSVTLGDRPFAMRPFCASQVTGGLFTFGTQSEESSRYRKPETAASARRSRACLPCAWFCGQVPACA